MSEDKKFSKDLEKWNKEQDEKWEQFHSFWVGVCILFAIFLFILAISMFIPTFF